MAELDHFRLRAEEARARHAAEPDGDLAETWLALAESWEALMTEAQATAPSPAP
jgi:hypothetical protein